MRTSSVESTWWWSRVNLRPTLWQNVFLNHCRVLDKPTNKSQKLYIKIFSWHKAIDSSIDQKHSVESY
jgi:hypothetical protein